MSSSPPGDVTPSDELVNSTNENPEREFVKTVLVIEDDADILDTIGAAISLLGYRAVKAQDRKSALERAKERAPDVIISDYIMSGLSLDEFVAELDRLNLAAEIIVCSASDHIATRMRLLGFKFLSKPFELDVLQNMIEGCLVPDDVKKSPVLLCTSSLASSQQAG